MSISINLETSARQLFEVRQVGFWFFDQLAKEGKSSAASSKGSIIVGKRGWSVFHCGVVDDDDDDDDWFYLRAKMPGRCVHGHECTMVCLATPCNG
jgi:hypothetical protein